MPHLVIFSAAGYGNAGDDAILEGTLRLLRGALGEAKLAVIGGQGLEKAAGRLDFTPLPVDDPQRWLRVIADADMVLLGGGGLLYDSTYQPKLEELFSPRGPLLYQCARVSAAAAAAGKKSGLFGIGVGPLLTEAGRAAARFVASEAEWSATRDEDSAALLRDLGIPPGRVHSAADPALLLESAPQERALAMLDEAGFTSRRRPWIGVNVRPWFDFVGAGVGRQERDHLWRTVAGACDRMVEELGASILFLPFESNGDDDAEAARNVIAQTARGEAMAVLNLRCRPSELQAIVGLTDLAVGMRLHALVFAANAGTPFVGLAYDPKVRAFAGSAGMAPRCLGVEDASAQSLAAAASSALADAGEIRSSLAQARAKLVEKAQVSAELVRLTLEGSAAPGRRALTQAPARQETQAQPAVERPRVLMLIRENYQEHPGGDAVQMLKTKAALEQLGVEVGISAGRSPDLSGWDLVHAFGISPSQGQATIDQCYHARRGGKPVALSTIYWDMREYWHRAGETLGAAWKAIAPQAPELARKEAQAAVALGIADVLLPNSEAERDLLARNFGVPLEKCAVVCNAVDDIFFDAAPGEFINQYGLSDFVLCVGRLELRKNQHSLLAALKDTGLPVVLVGPALDQQYLEACRASAGERVKFIEHIPHERLPSAYAAARVHVLPSWYDTPGLVSLEAAAAGCNIVSTDRGCTREYLKDMAWYCDPSDITSIRRAVLAAWEAPSSGKLREFVRQNYTWRRAAEQTLEGYRLALAGRPAESPESAARRLSEQVEAFRQYVSAQERYFDFVRLENERHIASLREAYEDLRKSYAHLEEEHRRLMEQYREDTRRLADAIASQKAEIEAITSRRLYRLGERLALLLRRSSRK